MEERDEDPRKLRKLLAEKDRQIADRDDLIKLLTSIPKPTSAEPSAKEATAPPPKTRQHKAPRTGETGRGNLPLDPSTAPRGAQGTR